MTDDARTRQVWDAIDASWSEQVRFLQELVGHESVLGKGASVQLAMQRKFESLGLRIDVFDADIARLGSMPGYSPVGPSPARRTPAGATPQPRWRRRHSGLRSAAMT